MSVCTWSIQFTPPRSGTYPQKGPMELPSFYMNVPQELIDKNPFKVRVKQYEAWYATLNHVNMGSGGTYGGAWEIMTNLPIDTEYISSAIVDNGITSANPSVKQTYCHFNVVNAIQANYNTSTNIANAGSGQYPEEWRALSSQIPTRLLISLRIPPNWVITSPPEKWTNRLTLEFMY